MAVELPQAAIDALSAMPDEVRAQAIQTLSPEQAAAALRAFPDCAVTIDVNPIGDEPVNGALPAISSTTAMDDPSEPNGSHPIPDAGTSGTAQEEHPEDAPPTMFPRAHCSDFLVLALVVPCVVLCFGASLGGILAYVEGWGFPTGLYYALGNLLGLANPLTTVRPSEDISHVVDVVVGAWGLSLAAVVICLVGSLGVIKDVKKYLERCHYDKAQSVAHMATAPRDQSVALGALHGDVQQMQKMMRDLLAQMATLSAESQELKRLLSEKAPTTTPSVLPTWALGGSSAATAPHAANQHQPASSRAICFDLGGAAKADPEPLPEAQ